MENNKTKVKCYKKLSWLLKDQQELEKKSKLKKIYIFFSHPVIHAYFQVVKKKEKNVIVCACCPSKN